MLRRIREMLKSQKGFTLVELMAVIAIIGVLAAIAVPRFASATDDATAAKIAADLRTIDSAISMNYASTGSYVTTVGALVPTYLQAVPTPPTGWVAATTTYTVTGNGATPPNAAALVMNGGTVYSSTPVATIKGYKAAAAPVTP